MCHFDVVLCHYKMEKNLDQSKFIMYQYYLSLTKLINYEMNQEVKFFKNSNINILFSLKVILSLIN